MSAHVLGVSFSGEELYGALVEHTDEGETLVRFTVSSDDPEQFEPELPGSAGFSDDPNDSGPGGLEGEEDVNIQFGDDDGVQGGAPLGEMDESGGGDGVDTTLIQSQFSTLLDACGDRGYEDPEIALCSPVGEMDHLELRLPDEEGTAQSSSVEGKPLPASRSALLELLEDQYEGAVEGERVGFLPLHPTEDGQRRVLALIARPGGAVLSTLASMQEQTLSRRLRVRLLETEISLYEGLARSARGRSAGPDETTALVRVGGDDTFVLFLRGETLLKVEHLPELTAEDPVETICSRVLLLRDEYGVGRIHHLLLALEANEEALIPAFEEYFPEAHTELVRTSLPTGGDGKEEQYTTATAVALRHLRDTDVETSFRPVNLLPGRYTARSLRFPVEWSVPVLLALIGLTTLGFVWYYVANVRAIGQRQTRLETLNEQIEQVDQPALEQRVETIQAMASRYEEGMETMNDLLDGSNKWSRQLAALTRSVNDVSGLSISQWGMRDGGVVLTGRANARPRVVGLVRQLDGEIDALSYTQVRDVRLYDFKMTVPLDTLKPRVIDYWKKQQSAQLASARSEAARSSADSSTDAKDATPQTSRTETASSNRAVPPEVGRWIIVVASLSDRSPAEAVREEFRDRLSDSRHAVRLHHSAEKSRYRVGVGGFDSWERARVILRALEAKLPSDAWIHDRGPNSNGETVAASSPTSEQ